MDTLGQLIANLNSKYTGRTNVDHAKHWGMDKLTYPKRFTATISNCECLTETTTSDLANKIDKKDITLMTRICLVPKRKKAYYEARVMWLERNNNQKRTRDKNSQAREAATSTSRSHPVIQQTTRAGTGVRSSRFFIQYRRRKK